MTLKKKTGKKAVIKQKTGIAKTISKQGQPDDNQRLYEARLKNIIDLTSEFYWEQDEHHRFTLIINPRTDTIDTTVVNLGKTRWEIGGIPVSDGGKWDNHKAQLKARKPFKNFIYSLNNPQLGRVYASISGRPRFDSNGRFIGYCGLTRDITREVREEQ